MKFDETQKRKVCETILQHRHYVPSWEGKQAKWIDIFQW